MDLEKAEKLAIKLMKKHGLIEEWSFEFDNAVRRFGYCSYRKKQISLSRELVLLNNFKEVKNVILHEIAHALVEPGNGHNWIWRQKAIEIGCCGKRCVSNNAISVNKKIVAICPNCSKKSGYYRMPRTKYSCGVCSGDKFNEEFLLVFKRINED